MKSLSKMLMMVASFMLVLSVSAQEAGKDKGQDGDRHDRHGRRGGDWGGMMGGFDPVDARKKMDELRKNADADGDGRLNQDERRKYFESMRTAWQQHRQEFVTKWDKDGNGDVDDEERKAFEANQVDEEFKKIDTNKDGMISPEEFKASKAKEREARQGLRDMWRRDRGDRGRGQENGQGTIERFDENGDGVVDDAEKTRAAEAILKRMEEKGLSGRWKEFDKDADGVLNGDERAAILKDLMKRLGNTGGDKDEVKPATEAMKKAEKPEAPATK